MAVKQLTINVSGNDPGVIAAISTALGRVGANIDSISAEGFENSGLVRIITRDSKSAREALERSGFSVREESVLVISMLDRPGELGKVSTLLAQAGVNVENIFMLSKERGEAVFAMRLSDENTAKRALGKYVREGY